MKIRNKAIVSIINSGEVLFTEGYDPVRDFRFYCPVGGGVEFGETTHAAAERELCEELGVEGQTLEFVNFHENMFEFFGKDEHEIMFHFICHISDSVRENLPAQVTESNGEKINISWHSKSELEIIEPNIVPPGIYGELVNAL